MAGRAPGRSAGVVGQERLVEARGPVLPDQLHQAGPVDPPLPVGARVRPTVDGERDARAAVDEVADDEADDAAAQCGRTGDPHHLLAGAAGLGEPPRDQTHGSATGPAGQEGRGGPAGPLARGLHAPPAGVQAAAGDEVQDRGGPVCRPHPAALRRQQEHGPQGDRPARRLHLDPAGVR